MTCSARAQCEGRGGLPQGPARSPGPHRSPPGRGGHGTSSQKLPHVRMCVRARLCWGRCGCRRTQNPTHGHSSTSHGHGHTQNTHAEGEGHAASQSRPRPPTPAQPRPLGDPGPRRPGCRSGARRRRRQRGGGGESPPPPLGPPPQLGAGSTLAPLPAPHPPAEPLRARPLAPSAPGEGVGGAVGPALALHRPTLGTCGRPPRWGRVARARALGRGRPLPLGAPAAPPPRRPRPRPPRLTPKFPAPGADTLRACSQPRAPAPAPRPPAPRPALPACPPSGPSPRRGRHRRRRASRSGSRSRGAGAGGSGPGAARSSRGRAPCWIHGDRAARAMPAGTPPEAGAR